MGLSEKDIDRLGPAARAQIAAALNHAAARRKPCGQNAPTSSRAP